MVALSSAFVIVSLMSVAQLPVCSSEWNIRPINQQSSSIMQRPNSDASLAISSQISRFILNKAREAYLQRVHTEAITQKSLQVSKQFPVECTQRMMELVSFQPICRPQGLPEEQQHSPLNSGRDHHRPLRTTNATPRLSANTHDRNPHISHKYSKKRTYQVMQPQTATLKCQPLASWQQQDAEIEGMREKKQRMFELQKYFVQAEKQEKSKLRHKQSEIMGHGNFTTDFNGEKIEMKGTHCKREADPYSPLEMNTTIREEKEENRFIISEERTDNKKTYRKESTLQETKQDTSTKSKRSKESVNYEAFTLKEIENFINKECKRRKLQNMNRVSRLRMPQITTVNLLKVL